MINVAFIVRLRVAFFAAGKVLLVVALLISTGVSAKAAPAPSPASVQGPQEAVGSSFVIENVGQFAGEARFLLKQGDQRIWLSDGAVWLTVPGPLADGEQLAPGARRGREVGRERQPAAVARPGSAIRFSFKGANPAPTFEPYGRVSTHVSYLLGNDPANWKVDVPVWSGVRYRDLYPGIDLVIGGGATGTVPWRLEAHPGADPNVVALRIEGANSVTAGGGQLRLELKDQTVGVALPGWSLEGQADLVESTAAQVTGEDAFALAPGTERQVKAAPADAAGVAAPGDLIYNTALAGALYDAAYAVAADGVGNVYITGETNSTNLPVSSGAYDPTNNGTINPAEAFVAKFDANGAGPAYLTYLGGGDQDTAWGIAVSGGLAFVAGETKSTNFPGMTGTVTGTDAFVAALNANGTGIRYVSRVGGTGYDASYAIAVEGLDAYLVGTTRSASVCAGSASGDLLAARLNSTGTPVYTTCLVSSATEAGYAIAVRNGEAYVSGETMSTFRSIIAARFNTSGVVSGGLEMGGANDDWSNGIAVDASGNIYVAGTTLSSTDFPVTAGTAAWGGGNTDAVVVRLTPSFQIDFATYLGGEGDDSGYGIAVDTVQGLYVTGSTTSATFPMTAGAYATAPFGQTDVFVARMHLQSAAADRVTYSTYLGTAGDDWVYGVATDTGGHAYVAGSNATSQDLASNNAFVAKVKVSSPPTPAPVLSIAKSGTNNALLSWSSAPTTSKYQLFRSSAPYFTPGDWSSLLPLTEPTGLSYPDPGALTPVNAYFYVVKAVDATPAASESSNRVGKFTFGLVKGIN